MCLCLSNCFRYWTLRVLCSSNLNINEFSAVRCGHLACSVWPCITYGSLNLLINSVICCKHELVQKQNVQAYCWELYYSWLPITIWRQIQPQDNFHFAVVSGLLHQNWMNKNIQTIYKYINNAIRHLHIAWLIRV